MRRFVTYFYCHSAVNFLLLISYNSLFLAPKNCYAVEKLTQRDIQIAGRVIKIAENIKKFTTSLDSKNLIKAMYELKENLEDYWQKSISINECLDNVFEEIKKKGQHLSKVQEKEIRLIFERKTKRIDHKKNYIEMCVFNNIEYNKQDEFLAFIAKHPIDEKQNIKVELPFRLVVGVITALCGTFLIFVGIPGTISISTFILCSGISLCVEALILAEEDKQRRNDKKKQE